MKIQTFLEKSVQIAGKLSPAQFIAKYREFIASFPSTAKVLTRLDKSSPASPYYPSKAYQDICSLIALEKDPVPMTPSPLAKAPVVRMVKDKTGKVSVKVEKAPKEEKRLPVYSVRLYRSKATMLAGIIEATYGADLYGDAERVAHNKLFRREDCAFAIIEGFGIPTEVSRNEATHAILRGRLGGNMRLTNANTANPRTSGKAKQYVAHFSHG